MKVVYTGYLPIPYVKLFHSKSKLCKFAHKFGIDTSSFPGDASVRFIEPDDESTSRDWYALVFLGKQDMDDNHRAALLAHEASHIVRQVNIFNGETDPGSEANAYLLQCITLGLLEADDKWRKKHGRTN